MKREALLLYLREVRDLEVALYHLKQEYNKSVSLKKEYQKKFDYCSCYEPFPDKRKYTCYTDYSEIPSLIGGIAVVGFIVWVVLGVIFSEHALGIGFLILVICIIVAAILVYGEMEDQSEKENLIRERYQKDYNEVCRVNSERAELRKQYSEKIKKQQKVIDRNKKRFEDDSNKIYPILDSLYGLNIIPARYRNLAAVYYMYEMFSTSQIDYSHLITHTQIEEGIRRIEAKFDIIIRQNEEIILTQRCIEAQNTSLIQKNKEMLDRLASIQNSSKQTEMYASETARYAELSANYNKANAYFSLANYLKK